MIEIAWTVQVVLNRIEKRVEIVEAENIWWSRKGVRAFRAPTLALSMVLTNGFWNKIASVKLRGGKRVELSWYNFLLAALWMLFAKFGFVVVRLSDFIRFDLVFSLTMFTDFDRKNSRPLFLSLVNRVSLSERHYIKNLWIRFGDEQKSHLLLLRAWNRCVCWLRWKL